MIDEISVEAASETTDTAKVRHLWLDVGNCHVVDQLVLGFESLLANPADELTALLPMGLLYMGLHAKRSIEILQEENENPHYSLVSSTTANI